MRRAVLPNSLTRRPSTARVLGRALPKALGSPRPDFRRCLSRQAFPSQQTRPYLSRSTQVCANGALRLLHTTPPWPMVFSRTSIRGISTHPPPTLCRRYGICCARCRGHYANAASAPRIFWQYHLLCGARFLPRRMQSPALHVWYPNRDEHLGHWFVFFLICFVVLFVLFCLIFGMFSSVQFFLSLSLSLSLSICLSDYLSFGLSFRNWLPQ